MSYKIFDHEPKTWERLEEMTCQAFHEMGYTSHQNYTVKTVRGDVKIDVYALNNKTSIPTIVLCECKYWNKPVNQQIIYSFRTICHDIGAHFGLIISKKGFQSGAETTRQSTNIHLLDFNQFQEQFFQEWRNGVCMEIVAMQDSFFPNMLKDKDLCIVSFKKYDLFNKVANHFIENKGFPISVIDPRGNIEETKNIKINSHRHFLEIAKEAYRDIQYKYKT